MNDILEKIPIYSKDYVRGVFENEDILIKLKKNRKTKHGDFSIDKNGYKKITINSNLNPNRILITLLH